MTTTTPRPPTPRARRAQKPTPLPSGSEWTEDAIARYNDEIARVAAHYKLDTYPVQIEVITAEQMMDAYASVGMPVNYHHWSFGKHFLATEKGYKRGQMGLAYEIVINSNPCIAYLMEENTLTMQGLVIAHAPTATTASSRATTCSARGPTPTPSSTTWCSRGITSPNARSATARKRSSCCSTPATR